MAIQGCRLGGPLGPGQTVGHAPNACHRSSSAAHLRQQWARPSPWGPRPSFQGRASRFWAVFPTWCRGSRRLVLAQTAAIPFQASTPRFWAVLQENGPGFDALPGFCAVVSVPRRDSRRWLRYNPRSEAFTSSMSRSAAYETAQNCTRALGRVANSPSVELPTKPPRTLLGHFADLRTLGIDWFTKPPRTLLGHFGSRIGLSVELPTKPLRTLLGRSAAERWMNIV